MSNIPNNARSENKDNIFDVLSTMQNVDTMDSLKTYLDEMAAYPLLTHEEEVVLATEILNLKKQIDSTSDVLEKKSLQLKLKKQQDKFIKHNLRLVVSVAKTYYIIHCAFYGKNITYNSDSVFPTFLDLIQIGNIGLMNAVEKYDITKGVKFSTHAVWWIRKEISRGIINQARIIRIPQYLITLKKRIKKLQTALTNNNPDLTSSEIMEMILKELNLSEEEFKICKSLDLLNTLDNIFPGTCGVDNIVDNVDEFDNIIIKIANEQMLDFLNCDRHLTDYEREILKLKYGFCGRCYTLEEISQKFGVTRQAVHAAMGRALKKLSELPKIKELKD